MSQPTDKKLFSGADYVITILRARHERKYDSKVPEVIVQFEEGEYDYLEEKLEEDEDLWGFVQDKIRWNYDEETREMTIITPQNISEAYLAPLTLELWTQVKAICSESGKKADFARNVKSIRSTSINFKHSKSSFSPDASFWHRSAYYPGVIIEVALSKTKTRLLRQLAEKYILYSDANIRVVVGIKLPYHEGSRKATLSVWRSQICETLDGPELRAVDEVVDQAFRDNDGNLVDHSGSRLRLSDFACESLVKEKMGDEDAHIWIPAQNLCEYINEAEEGEQGTIVLEPSDPPVTRRLTFMESTVE